MTSLLCVKQPGGKVQVHSNEFLDELVSDSHEHSKSMILSKNEVYKRKPRRPHSTPARPTHGMDSQSLIGQTLKIQDWLNDKTVKGLQFAIPNAWVERQLKQMDDRTERSSYGCNFFMSDSEFEEKSDVETRAARKLYNPLLETEGTFVRDVDNFISYKGLMDLRKKEMLHKKWNDQVYEPLRKKIIEAMDSEDWPELDRRKRELHKQYLEFVNQKGHVFLDTMDPSEYYAQALNGHRPAPIKVATKAFRDPLLSQGRERNAEERTILRCLTGYDYTDRDIEQVKLPPLPLVPLGRHGTDSIRWLEMPLHNIESTPRMASRRRMHGIFNRSQLDFEEWSRLMFDPIQVERELQTQKKRMYKETPPFNIPPREIPSSYVPQQMFDFEPVMEEPENYSAQTLEGPKESQTVSIGAS